MFEEDFNFSPFLKRFSAFLIRNQLIMWIAWRFAIFHQQKRWALIRTGSEWIKIEDDFGRIRTASVWNFFENCRVKTGSDWENICCSKVIILSI